uniref:Uncharacterized protein n=1 Tax=Siphoviridae sp. ctRon5 TaxID=2825505 RepID=A0A8S5U0D0_9CAUD|nr:MAG TPA: hypothetical protein [Siphoviridae sp. ctRon5]
MIFKFLIPSPSNGHESEKWAATFSVRFKFLIPSPSNGQRI